MAARRRWGRIVLVGLTALLSLIVAAVLVIAWVPAASRALIEAVLTRWDATNPARLEWRAIEGSLAGGLRVDGLLLVDGDERPLLRVDRIELELGWWSLLRGVATVERLALGEVEVWAAHAWADLADPDAPPKPPEPGYGPDLPIEVRATVVIDDARVWLDAREHIDVQHLRASGWGAGRSAAAELAAAMIELPSQALRVDSLALAAHWDSPRVQLDRLRLDSPWLTIEQLRGDYDVERERGELVLDADAQLERLAEQFELPLAGLGERADIRLRVRGGPAELALMLDLGLGAAGELRIDAAGVPTGPTDRRWAGARVRGRLELGVLTEQAVRGLARFDLLAHVRGRERQSGLLARLDGDVHELHSGEQLRLHADATVGSLDPLHGRASARLDGAGLQLRAQLERDAAALRGRWSLQADSLTRPLGVLASLLDRRELAEIRGRLAAEGRCNADPAGAIESLQCEAELQLANGSGYQLAISHAHARARVWPLADPLAIEAKLTALGLRVPGEHTLDRLELDARGTIARLQLAAIGVGPHERVQLAGAVGFGDWIDIELDRLAVHSDRGQTRTRIELRRPTRLRISAARVDIDALSLAVANGRIDVDGHLGLASGSSSDLRVDIDALQLARLDPLVPGPSFAGQLSLQATLIGALPEPSVWLRVHGRKLRVAGLRPGDVELVAAYVRPTREAASASSHELALRALLAEQLGERVDASLRVWARVRGPMAAHASIAAALPLRIADGPRLLDGRELAARVAVEQLDLHAFASLMPDTPSWWRQGDPKLIPEARVDIELSLAGTPERPRASAQVLARKLAIDRVELGSLLARGSLDDSGAGLQLTLKPGFGQLELRARLPATLDLRHGTFEWAREAEGHLLSLDLVALDLEQLHAALGPKLPALDAAFAQAPLGGLISLSVRASGSLASPRVAAALRAGNLSHADQPLGHVHLLANSVPGDAVLDLHMDGPLARRLDAHLRVPLYLPSDHRALQLDPERELAADVHADALSLAVLARHLGPLPIAGLLSGTVQLSGTLADPQADLHARIDGLATSREPLGELSVRAGFDAGQLHVHADMSRDGAPILAAAAELPILVELHPQLADSRVRWHRAGRHRVYASARNIDDELLAALLGRPLAGDSPLGGGRTSELEFDLAGSGSVDAFRLAATLAGDVAVDDQLALELDLGLALDQATQRLDLSVTPTRGQPLIGSVELAASVPALIAGEQRFDEVPFTARLLAQGFDLRGLQGLLPSSVVEPRGALHANLRGRGSLGVPQLRGMIELDDAAITVIPMRQRITDIQLELAMSERRVDLHELALTAGRGGVEGSGQLSFGDRGSFDGDLQLAIESFPLIRPGLPAMTVDTGVVLDVRRRPGDTAMAVMLLEPAVTVAGASEALPKPIPRSDDVVILTSGPAAAAVEPAQPGEPAQSPAPERFKLRVHLREPLLISGTSIDMAWAGAVELEVAGDEVEVGGQIEARRGTLRLFGNSFDLRRGVVTLPDDGSLDPYLDVEAVASLPDAEVTVTVTGRVSRPTLAFSSNPALTEYQILTLLITGSTEIGESDGDVATKAASLLAAVSNPQLQNQLNQRLGLDRVAIGFGETIDQPIFTVGKRFGRDVYVETEYHHNAPEDQNTTQIAIEYGFLPRWSLEGFFGDAAVGALGIYWTRTFPAAKWAANLRMPDLQIEH